MAVWHWMIGIGMAVVVALVTQYRALPSASSYDRARRKNDFFADDLNDVCAICREIMNNSDAKYLNCGHAYHDRCVTEFKKYKSECPKCRTKI